MAWSTDLASTDVEAHKRVQNSALQIVTRCTKSTPIAHLHAETRVLAVKDHLNMRGIQFYTNAADPKHLCNHLLPQPPGTSIEPRPSTTAVCSAKYPRFPQDEPKDHGYMSNSSLSTCPMFQLTPSWKNHHPSLQIPSPPFPGNPESTWPDYQNRIYQTTDPTCRCCGADAKTITHLLEDSLALSALRVTYGVQHASHLWSRLAETLEFLRSAGFL